MSQWGEAVILVVDMENHIVTITLPKEGRVQVKKNQYLKKNKEV